jgi:hypothetical protein
MADSHLALNTHTQDYLIGGLHAYVRSKETKVKPYYNVDKFSMLNIQ